MAISASELLRGLTEASVAAALQFNLCPCSALLPSLHTSVYKGEHSSVDPGSQTPLQSLFPGNPTSDIINRVKNKEEEVLTPPYRTSRGFV